MICRFLLLVFWLACFGVASSEAHLGEAEAALTARYGPPHGRQMEHTLVQGRAYVVGERLMFRNADWRVVAVMQDGACIKITYARRGRWAEAQFDSILAANAGSSTWSEIVGEAPKWQRTWRRSDGLVAKWLYAGGFIIESHAFVDARDRIRSRALFTDRSSTSP